MFPAIMFIAICALMIKQPTGLMTRVSWVCFLCYVTVATQGHVATLILLVQFWHHFQQRHTGT